MLAKTHANLPVDGQPLREEAVRAIEEGRADHAAGRTFTLPEIREDLRRAPKRPDDEEPCAAGCGQPSQPGHGLGEACMRQALAEDEE